jgi:hypothetical protein
VQDVPGRGRAVFYFFCPFPFQELAQESIRVQAEKVREKEESGNPEEHRMEKKWIEAGAE